MFRNYFVTAWRNFLRNKTFSVINILGLSIGLCASLVIFLIVYYDESYDRFEPGRERIYRVVLDANFNGSEGHSAAVPAPLGDAMRREITGTDLTVPIFQFQGDGSAKVSIAQSDPDKPVIFKKQREVVFTNKDYLTLLDYKWLAGSYQTALQEPFSLVLTESRAHQYFPHLELNDIIGRRLTYNDETTASVTGIVNDLNENTGFTSKEFISLATIAKTNLNDRFMMNVWDDWMAYSKLYVRLEKGKSQAAVETQLRQLFAKNTKPQPNGKIDLRLQPLADVHFNSTYASFGQRTADKNTLWGLLAVSVFLLLLAAINFINLSTAQATKRAKEIGVRKTMGGSRKQLIGQYLVETFVLTSIAAIVSLVLSPFLLNVFSDFIPEGLHFSTISQPVVLLFLLAITVVVSFLAGLYPALVLSKFNPSRVLKNQAFTGSSETRSVWIRKTLTVSQFVIAQFFIIGTLLVSKQIKYSLHADMGFQKDAILTFDVPRDTVATHTMQLQHALNAIPQVELVSNGFMPPGGTGMAITNVSSQNMPDLKANVQLRYGDSNFVKLYQLRIIAGRNVRRSDSFEEFLVNETFAKMLGFNKPEEALGKTLTFNKKELPIVGVMKDFHASSFHMPIGPIVFAGGKGNTFHVKLRPNTPGGNQWTTAISSMQAAFKVIYPEADFEYKFLDDNLAQMYKSERNMSSLLTWATGLMIFISCLGLLGLVIYTTDRRKKEIGIRKILGASVTNIVAILSKDFMLLPIAAFIIAAPLAWFTVSKWLENFVYRTDVSWWIFALTVVMTALFAFATLSIQTIRSAVVNPAKSLRTD